MRANLFVGLAIAGFSSVLLAEVKVAASRIDESRTFEVAGDGSKSQGGSLQIQLALNGPEADKANRYGKVKITQATDDKGTNLVPDPNSVFGGDEFREYSNAFFRDRNTGNDKTEAPKISIQLGTPARDAAKVAVLKGEFQLMDTGALKTVQVSDLPKLAGKEIQDPALKEAGIKVKIKTAKPGSTQVELMLSGDTSGIQDIGVFRGEQDLKQGLSGFSMPGSWESKAVVLAEPLTADMHLLIKLTTGKDTTTVPFELKDIALP